jgi:hypothetical protein
MTLLRFLARQIERHIAAIGIALTIIFGVLGAYSVFHERAPGLSFEILSETDVLDVRQPLTGLEILFQGVNMQEHNLNLRIVRFTVRNVGEVDILQNMYDATDIWGFRVENARIIEVRLVQANSDYLMLNVSPQLAGEDTVRFNKVIFERGKFFTVETQIIHRRDLVPELKPLGKIAGIETVRPTLISVEPVGRSIVADVLHGSPLIHVVRAMLYAVVFVLTAAGVAVVSILISDRVEAMKRRGRQQAVAGLAMDPDVQFDNWMRAAAELYIEDGLKYLKMIAKLLEDESALTKAVEMYQRLERRLADRIAQGASPQEARMEVVAEAQDRFVRFSQAESAEEHVYLDYGYAQVRSHGLVRSLLKCGAITIDADQHVTVDSDFRSALRGLIQRLEARGAK